MVTTCVLLGFLSLLRRSVFGQVLWSAIGQVTDQKRIAAMREQLATRTRDSRRTATAGSTSLLAHEKKWKIADSVRVTVGGPNVCQFEPNDSLDAHSPIKDVKFH